MAHQPLEMRGVCVGIDQMHAQKRRLQILTLALVLRGNSGRIGQNQNLRLPQSGMEGALANLSPLF